MDKKELLLKAYLGECIPGLVHNMGNPLGALLGFVSIMREEVTWLRHDMETFPEEGLRDRVKESLTKISELFDFALRSEQSLRKALEKMVIKCGKDFESTESDIDANELVKIETDVLMTNTFFKHKINKKFEYSPSPFMVHTQWSALSQPIGSILFRYTVALANVNAPKLSIRTMPKGNRIAIEIRANAQLAQCDLGVDNGSLSLPALTLKECQDVLKGLGCVSYAALEAGNSAVTFDIASHRDMEEGISATPSAPHVDETFAQSARSAASEVSLSPR